MWEWKEGIHMSKKVKAQNLEVTLFDGYVNITRNYSESSVIPVGNSKAFIALIDALTHPGKYIVHIHDFRENEVYSKLSCAIEEQKIIT